MPKPKAILFATGLAKPPAQEQVLPIGLVRIGHLVLAAGPAEFTTMAGRRIREPWPEYSASILRHVVVAGYANDYAGYVTTREEYESQQYEGGHTLFGPWTEAAYRQEYVPLLTRAEGRAGRPIASNAGGYQDAEIPRAVLDGPDESPPTGGKFGDTITDANERYTRGDRVTVSFWTGSPVNDYQRTDHFMAVERLARSGANGRRCGPTSTGTRRAGGSRPSTARYRKPKRTWPCRVCRLRRSRGSFVLIRTRSR